MIIAFPEIDHHANHHSLSGRLASTFATLIGYEIHEIVVEDALFMSQVQLSGRPFSRGTARVQGLVTGLHVWLYRATGGRIGHYLGKIPTLLLSTTGRKSGKHYTTPLTYVRDGDDLVLIASNGGTAAHPSWWLNLQVQPETTVQVGAQTLRVRATLASPDQRTRLWEMAVAIYPGYTGYQQRTARQIPVVVLQPLAG